MTLALILVAFVLFLGFHIWAVRAYLEFLTEHPEVERQVVARALKQSC